MARVAQSFTVRVSEVEDFQGHTVENFDLVRMAALRKVGMTPHRKYFGRIRRIRSERVGALRRWKIVVVRP